MLSRRLPLRRRNLTLILSVVLVFVVLGLAVSHQAFAQEPKNLLQAATNPIGNAIFLFLNTIIWAITKLVSVLTYVFISILIVVARYNTFLNAPVVVSGWPIVRDLMNMMFIIALIIIAAGTVLRLQNYRYNRLLGKLIIMAFLVNFSKFIAVFLLQFAQVVMLTFVNAFREAAFGNFSSMFGLDSVFAFSVKGTFSTSIVNNLGGFSIFISMLAGLVMMIVAFVVTLSMTVMLFVRIIALWLLIIMSPIAFALRILPNTEKYASQWWSEFTKYAVLGPVLAFFLWLALAVVAATPTCTQAGCNNPLGSDPAVRADLGTVDNDSANLRGDLVTKLLGVDKMVTFVVSIIFLMMGLQYAQKSGAAGAAFAGKVAENGFGFAKAVTGYNAIKDRTVAPIQGWLKNRQAARQSAIQERTESVEAAGDRVKARFGPTQGARERGRAAANAYERSRTARTAQKQGFKDQTDDALQDKFLFSKNRRERMAAMTELANRDPSNINLGDKAQNEAFEYLTNYQRERFGDKLPTPLARVAGVLPKFPLADAEMPWGERQQLRNKILGQNIKSENEDALRKHAGTIDTKDSDKDLALRDRRVMSTQELDRRQLLKASNPDDVALIEQLERDVMDSPEKHRQFKESLMKNNPDMAMHVLFNGLKTAGDREAYKSAIQQKQISTSSMNKGLYDSLGNNAEGMKVREDLANHLVAISPDAETLQSYWKNMDPEAAHMFGKHINMKDEQSIDRRNMVAKVTGEWGRAFQDGDGNPLYMGKDGKPITQAAAKADPLKVKKDDKGRGVLLGQEYFDKLGGDEVLRTLTPEAIKSARVQEMMRRSPNWTFPNSATLRTRSDDSRQAQAAGLQAGMAEILAKPESSGAQGADGKIDFAKITNENEKAEVISMAQQLFLASKGATNPYDMTDGSEGAKLFASTISGAKATDYSKIAKSVDYDKGSEDYKKSVRVAIGRNGTPGQLSDLLLMEREFTADVLTDTEDVLTKEFKDSKKEGKARNVLRGLANQEGVRQFINYNPSEYRGKSSESDKGTGGESKGGGGKTAAAAAAAGVAGAVIGATAAGGRKEERPDEPPEPPENPDEPHPTGGTPAPRSPKPPVSGTGGATPTSPESSETTSRAQQSLEGKAISVAWDGPQSPFARLYDPAVNEPEAIIAAVTPEMKRAMLQHILQNIDWSINQTREFVEKNPGKKVGKKNMLQNVGMGVNVGKDAHVYQKIAVAGGAPVMDTSTIARMPIADYLKKYLGYDLASDSKRAGPLRQYTNALEGVAAPTPAPQPVRPTPPSPQPEQPSTPKPVPTPAPTPAPKTPEVPPVRPTPQPKAAEPKAAAPVKPASVPTPPPPPPTRPPETTPTAPTPQPAQETVGSHREVDDVLTRLASAKAEEMGALREVFEKGVKHLEQTSIAGAREGAKAIREQFERLPHGGTGGVDHETQKRLFREFGEELKRTIHKNPTGSATVKGASPTTAPRPTPSKPAKPKA